MKIAIIVDDISVPYGLGRAVTNLAHILTSRNIEVHILSRFLKEGNTSIFLKTDKVIIHHLSAADTDNSFLNKLILQIRLFYTTHKLLIKENFSIVIGTRCIQNCFLPFYAFNCKTMGCEHGNYMYSSLLRRVIRRFCYPLLDATVLLTHHDAEHYTFVPKKKRFVIPNSLSFTCDTPSDCENKRIITLGRLDPQKGYDYLLQTAVKLKQEIPDWHIDIFGSGDDEEMLKDLAKKLKVDDFVSFHPPTKEVTKELCSSGMYVMSSRFEGLPMVLLEAQECGLPIVSFDCPEGPSEVIHDGEDGFLVPLADTDALAEKIITLAKDQEMRKRFGQTAKINCQQFSPEKVGEMWLDLIKKLTEKK